MNCKIEQMDLLECTDILNYKQYEATLFEIYKKLYEENAFFYKGKLVQMKHYPPNYGQMSGFKHLIYENYDHTRHEDDRLPNLNRCERIEWPRTIIETCSEDCPSLYVWENKRRSDRNILLYCDDFNYLVVLTRRNGYFLLKTAYPVEDDRRREDLLKEYYRYKQRTQPS